MRLAQDHGSHDSTSISYSSRYTATVKTGSETKSPKISRNFEAVLKSRTCKKVCNSMSECWQGLVKFSSNRPQFETLLQLFDFHDPEESHKVSVCIRIYIYIYIHIHIGFKADEGGCKDSSSGRSTTPLNRPKAVLMPESLAPRPGRSRSPDVYAILLNLTRSLKGTLQEDYLQACSGR